MKTLNQTERSPIPVEDQVVQIFAATNGYIDRIAIDKVERFLVELIEGAHATDHELLQTQGRGRGLERGDAGSGGRSGGAVRERLRL